MKQLQADFSARFMHGPGHMTMQQSSRTVIHRRRQRGQLPHQVGRKATGYHEPDATFRPFGKIPGELVDIPETVFEAGMHRPHQHPILELSEPQFKRFQQVGIGVGHGALSSNIYREYTLDQWQVDLT